MTGAFESNSDPLNGGSWTGLEILLDDDPVLAAAAVLLDGFGHRQQRLERQQVGAERIPTRSSKTTKLRKPGGYTVPG